MTEGRQEEQAGERRGPEGGGERREKEEHIEGRFAVMIAEDFPPLVTDARSQVREAQRTPGGINM